MDVEVYWWGIVEITQQLLYAVVGFLPEICNVNISIKYAQPQ